MVRRFSPRLAAGLAAFLLTSCGKVSPDVSELGDQPVECALAGAKTFTADCYLQAPSGTDAGRRVILHPDGGFRVFQSADTASGLAPADGAIVAVEEVVGDTIVVSVGLDRYRFEAEAADD